jgi:inosine-uridine nucleoside N-ribohydrolase
MSTTTSTALDKIRSVRPIACIDSVINKPHCCNLGIAFAGQGRYGTFLADITKFYVDYHRNFYCQDYVYVHDPSALVACLHKDLFQWHQGAVVVCTEGAMRGKTVVDGEISRECWTAVYIQ